jgi:predicted O-methyltransferase YrrM
VRDDVADYLARRPTEVPGWLAEVDFRLFDWLLDRQGPGDLLEIGAYEGASAILLGLHRRDGETLTVCDLFAVPDEDDENFAESAYWYRHLTRERFEANYLKFLPELPRIVQETSLEIRQHVEAGSCRFVHVDGAHAYSYARSDIASARSLLNRDGIVVCDDWRGRYTPGVTVAAMEALVSDGLNAVAITEGKFYGTWNAALASELRDEAAAWAESSAETSVVVEPIRGERWPRILLARAAEPARSSTRARLRRVLGGRP